MGRQKKILLVGETWVSSSTHFKGFDQFGSVTFHSGAAPFTKALADTEFDVVHMPAHEAVENLPFDIHGLRAYDAIVLSDIGANSLLLHPDVWLTGKPVPNRLSLLKQWTQEGGGLAMIGGYLSFQGIDGRARWHRTPVEEVLPVTCLPYDDRLEIPEGFSAVVPAGIDHPIINDVPGPWPLLLGANEVRVKNLAGVEVLARMPESAGGHPLLVVGSYGRGRTLAWTSDLSPHWLPASFSDWDGYAKIWRNAMGWLTPN